MLSVRDFSKKTVAFRRAALKELWELGDEHGLVEYPQSAAW